MRTEKPDRGGRKVREVGPFDKGNQEGKAKKADAQLGEWITPTVKAEQATKGKEEPILKIGMVNNPLKRKEPPKIMIIKEMVFPPTRNRVPSVDVILISVQVMRKTL
ncbi:hypothetical protein Tco_0015051 [Tanacetum coccineum]